MTALKTRKKEFTLAEAGISSTVANRLVIKGELVEVGVKRTGKRGRPATLFSKV